MSKYTEEFKRNAIELMKKAGITKACKELKISHCTLYRWCKELEGKTVIETEESADGDLDAMMETHTEESAQETEPTSQLLQGANHLAAVTRLPPQSPCWLLRTHT